MSTLTAAEPQQYVALTPPKRWYVRLGRVARQKPLGAAGGVILIIFIITAFFGTDFNLFGRTIVPGFAAFGPESTDVFAKLEPPSVSHLFGTDTLGRDMFARTVAGARTAMIIGIAATGLAIVAGTVIGLVSAYGGGRIDLVIQRIMDAFMSLPPLILLLVLVTVLSPSMFTVIMVLIFFVAPSTSRVIRGSTLVIKELQYVEAARTIGASPTRIMFRHMFPNLIAPILVLSSVLIGTTITTEAALSFLGLGAHSAENPTWGFMLNQALQRGNMAHFWWLAIFPGVAITLTVLAFNLLGDALRDIFDPRLRGTGAGA